MEDNPHFTKPIPKTKGETKIVKGTSVKITRAIAGSMGKSTTKTLAPPPDKDWLDLDALADAKGKLSGFGRWDDLGARLNRVEDTKDIDELPKLPSNEKELVGDTAEEKSRELQGEEAKTKSRYDAIDLDVNEAELSEDAR